MESNSSVALKNIEWRSFAYTSIEIKFHCECNIADPFNYLIISKGALTAIAFMDTFGVASAEAVFTAECIHRPIFCRLRTL